MRNDECINYHHNRNDTKHAHLAMAQEMKQHVQDTKPDFPIGDHG